MEKFGQDRAFRAPPPTPYYVTEGSYMPNEEVRLD